MKHCCPGGWRRPKERDGIGWIQVGNAGSTPKDVLEYTLCTPTRELEESVRAMSPIDGNGNGGSSAERVFFDSHGANDFWVSGDLWSQGKATDAPAPKQISETATSLMP